MQINKQNKNEHKQGKHRSLHTICGICRVPTYPIWQGCKSSKKS